MDAQNESVLESEIKSFGQSIFAQIGREQPSAFNKNALNGKMMQWSMKRPELKVNLFRLVDVLPTLKSSASIAAHASEYLEKAASDINSLFGLALRSNPGMLRAALTSRAVRIGVHMMAKQFIAGATPQAAIKPLQQLRKNGSAFTVDLLGEFSVSEKEALVYLERYMNALETFSQVFPNNEGHVPLIVGHPGEVSPNCISVKLSALYSQCSPLNFARSVQILSERLQVIALKAKQIGALLYVDAEDSANNPIIYQVFKETFSSAQLKDFYYPGIVVQAYSKTAATVLEDLLTFAKKRGAPLAVRLVKGAYWDHETILSQQNNWPSPLFAKKESSDANYEQLSRFLIDNAQHFLPAFGSHNIRSLSHACCYARSKGLSVKDFEIQILYGMADPIAKAFKSKGYLTRYYVPLGEILPGMGYLVRRLLENTSNESFLRHTFFDEAETAELLSQPHLID